MTVGRTIDYEALSQDAMRGVVRSILADAAKNGLPGDHHFYISFETRAPGVLVSKRLLEKYAEEMTIVLQHRFWDLFVAQDQFEVKLTFDGIPERLVVPFTAIRVFFDPSVRYGLQFETATDGPGTGEAGDSGGRALIVQMGPDPSRGRPSERKPRPRRKARIEKPADAPMANGSGTGYEAAAPLGPTVEPFRKPLRPVPAADSGSSRGAAQSERDASPHQPPEPPTDTGPERPAVGEPKADAAPAPQPNGAQVVSLDAFRKK